MAKWFIDCCFCVRFHVICCRQFVCNRQEHYSELECGAEGQGGSVGSSSGGGRRGTAQHFDSAAHL